jgi:hypothetical protein
MPKRTLRNLQELDAPDLVKHAVREHLSFKHVVDELKKRPPSKAAAEAVIEAYRRGDAPPWLAAVLLGKCRDRVGYATAREILLSAPREGAESYAGVALAEMGGPDALDDLKALMISAPDRKSREGAAYGLEALALPEAGPAILEAVLAGKIKWDTGGRILGSTFPGEGVVLGLLRSGDMHQVRLATDIVESCVSSARSNDPPRKRTSFASSPSATLLKAIGGALSDPDIIMAPRKRTRLRSWFNNATGA